MSSYSFILISDTCKYQGSSSGSSPVLHFAEALLFLNAIDWKRQPIHDKKLLDRRRIEVAKEWTLRFEPFGGCKGFVVGSLEGRKMKAGVKGTGKRGGITLKVF
ncbi:uncharacterized protein DFL_005831 [Arthrobotrys flagrans]|uniref:Uncharacterized protein n=1 Tax=Arthrobotrys flagrans TaxID=97331 RepID=A0A436ZZ61_ARTFL|nr:hypothetical protein DFL_005831 [Arthrobotrys flagrans]